jgi:hypothetical protein
MPSSFYTFGNYREEEPDPSRAVFRSAVDPDLPLRGEEAQAVARGISERIEALTHYLLHAGEGEIRLSE